MNSASRSHWQTPIIFKSPFIFYEQISPTIFSSLAWFVSRTQHSALIIIENMKNLLLHKTEPNGNFFFINIQNITFLEWLERLLGIIKVLVLNHLSCINYNYYSLLKAVFFFLTTHWLCALYWYTWKNKQTKSFKDLLSCRHRWCWWPPSVMQVSTGIG